eukprot:SAG22_NODE_1710_length_3761_cov_2.537957_4_plen_508_part_00
MSAALFLLGLPLAASRVGSGGTVCTGAAKCTADCLQDLIDHVQATCCPDPDACPGGTPTTCSRQCGRKFNQLYNMCHNTVDLDNFRGFQTQCETVVRADQQTEDDQCEVRDAMSVVLQCADYGSAGQVAADLDAFCVTRCRTDADRFLTTCAPEMASTGHEIIDGMIVPLQSYVEQCPPAPPPEVACNTNRLVRFCDPSTINDIVPLPGDDPIATFMKCNTPCAQLLLQDGMFESCVAHQEDEGMEGFEVFEPLVDACSLLEEDEECMASKDTVLTEIGAVCGCPDGTAMGGRNSDCDAAQGHFPCTSDCADLFLPWFSECAWAAFGTSDPSTLTRFSSFARKCAATDARDARQETLSGGADPADECSQITDCASCGAVDGVPVEDATCGWCRRELHVSRNGLLAPPPRAHRMVETFHLCLCLATEEDMPRAGTRRRVLQLDLRDNRRRVPATCAPAMRAERTRPGPPVRRVPSWPGFSWRCRPAGPQHALQRRDCCAAASSESPSA